MQGWFRMQRVAQRKGPDYVTLKPSAPLDQLERQVKHAMRKEITSVMGWPASTHSAGAHKARLPRKEMQPRDRGVMRVPDDCVQLALLQVPHCDHARAPACRHEWNARACGKATMFRHHS